MPNVYYDKDADLSLLQGKTIGIIGYGSQGHAHALNLKDNGQVVLVGLHPGSSSREKAREAGLEVVDVPDAVQRSDIVMVLIPDHVQAGVYKEQIEPHIKPGSQLMFAHGFCIHYRQVVPSANLDVSMVAPKAPGHRMRELFTEGIGVPSLMAIHQNASGHAKELTLAYARGVGSTGAGVLETTFKNSGQAHAEQHVAHHRDEGRQAFHGAGHSRRHAHIRLGASGDSKRH